MSVRKRRWTNAKGVEKEAWVVDYVDQHGKRRLKTFQRKKEAEAFSAKARTEVADGVHVADRATITVREAGEKWIESAIAAGLERTTVDQYRQHLTLHIAPFIGTRRLSEVTVPMVRAFQDRLRAGDPSLPDDDKTKAPRSAVMVRRVTVSLGSILAAAQDRGLVVRNPVREMGGSRRRAAKGERRQKGRLRYGEDIPTREEVRAIIAHAEGRYRPLLVTAIFTGMRASELRGLRWDDVDLDKAVLHVHQRADAYHTLGRPKSEAGNRTIPLPPIVVNTLREWRLACPKGELGLVFPNGRGNIESHGNIVKRGLWPAQVAAGVTRETGERDEEDRPVLAPRYTGLHALRHWFASWCINRRSDGGLELPAKMVQARLGHSTVTMTLDVYGHLFPSLDDADALADAERSLLSG